MCDDGFESGGDVSSNVSSDVGDTSSDVGNTSDDTGTDYDRDLVITQSMNPLTK